MKWSYVLTYAEIPPANLDPTTLILPPPCPFLSFGKTQHACIQSGTTSLTLTPRHFFPPMEASYLPLENWCLSCALAVTKGQIRSPRFADRFFDCSLTACVVPRAVPFVSHGAYSSMITYISWNTLICASWTAKEKRSAKAWESSELLICISFTRYACFCYKYESFFSYSNNRIIESTTLTLCLTLNCRFPVRLSI